MITYQAKTYREFADGVRLLIKLGVPPASLTGVIKPERIVGQAGLGAAYRGFYEALYVQVTGERMRLTDAEIESKIPREEIAKTRLNKLGIDLTPFETLLDKNKK